MKHMFGLLILSSTLNGVCTGEGTNLPSVEEILTRYVDAIGGKAAIEKISTRVMKGTFEVPAEGISGPAEIYAKAPDLFLSSIQYPDFGNVLEGNNGKTAWTKNPDSGLREINGTELTTFKRDHDFYRELKLNTFFPRMTVKERVNLDSGQAYLVEAAPAGGDIEKLFFDLKSGLLIRRDFERVTIDEGITPVKISYEDYREVDGVKLPFTVTQATPDYVTQMKFTEIKQNIPIDTTKFDKPAAP